MPRIAFIFVIALFLTPFSASADTINACANKTNGNLRLVADPGQCKNNEAPISWESEGPPGPSSFQLVGFTSATIGRGNGIFALTAACQSEFSDSRICEGVEVLRTVDLPDLSSAGSTEAWVRPTYVGGGSVIAHASGLNMGGDCLHYTSASSARESATVDIDGKFQLLKCDIVRSIACCAPVP